MRRFALAALLVLGCSSSDRTRDIKTAIDAARAACLIYDATKEQLTKPVLEAAALCPVLLAAPAVKDEPSYVADGGAGGAH